MFIQNKYYKWYYSIVNHALSREISNDIYTEKHHIIPKSLGGSNKKENLVALFAREHFICHLCLAKFTSGIAKRKMSFACRMLLARHKQKGVRITSRMYEIVKRISTAAHKEWWAIPENANRMKASRKRFLESDKGKECMIQQSETLKRLWEDPTKLAEWSLAMTKRWADPKVREEQSIRQKQLHIDHPEIGKKKSRPGELNGMFNKTHTDEVKASLALLPVERFGGKTYEEIYGEEKAAQLKADRSIATAKWRAESPNYGKGKSNPNAKTYVAISPTNETYSITGELQKFCKEHQLEITCVFNVIKGRQKRHKGWDIKHATK